MPKLLMRAERYIQVREYTELQEKRVFDPFTGDHDSNHSWSVNEYYRTEVGEEKREQAAALKLSLTGSAGSDQDMSAMSLSRSARVLVGLLPVHASFEPVSVWVNTNFCAD